MPLRQSSRGIGGIHDTPKIVALQPNWSLNRTIQITLSILSTVSTVCLYPVIPPCLTKIGTISTVSRAFEASMKPVADKSWDRLAAALKHPLNEDRP